MPTVRNIEQAGLNLKTDRQRRLQLWFYIGVPLIIGFFLGWTQVGRSAEWPKHFSLLYWLGVSFGSLLFLELLTPPLASVLRPRGVPLWITLVVAQVFIGWVAILPVMRLYTEWVQSFLPLLLAGPLQDGSFSTLLQKLPTNIICWVSTNLLFFYAFGMARFGYQPPGRRSEGAASIDVEESSTAEVIDPTPDINSPVADAAQAMIAFLTRVRPDRNGTLLAIQADGHYLHVHTDVGSDLILYRFGDALNELKSLEGMQVHRSWWVAERAVERQEQGEKLILGNGLEVPVSRSYRVQARERGWLP